MASRVARTIFSAGARASVRPTRVAQQIGKRYNSASSHGASATPSDKPWIIGSAIIFGPALLYLLSPSAGKSTAAHATHKHEENKAAESSIPPSEVKMKDDEDTEEDVTGALVASEHEDALKVGEVPVEQDLKYLTVPATSSVEKDIKEQETEEVKRDTSEPDAASDETTEKGDSESGRSSTSQGIPEEQPTDVGDVQKATRETTPKTQA
ncbi:hypothetical protein AX15_004283 [Amanita polypyramis BW_CC]|nr:hypothetical protein AX15_004283 [Amanita polypyramis BW_CC]